MCKSQFRTNITSAEDLQVGDVIETRGTTVTVLRGKAFDVEHVGPQVGRAVIRYWCKRADTGAEGYMTYGTGGTGIAVVVNPDFAASAS